MERKVFFTALFGASSILFFIRFRMRREWACNTRVAIPFPSHSDEKRPPAACSRQQEAYYTRGPHDPVIASGGAMKIKVFVRYPSGKSVLKRGASFAISAVEAKDNSWRSASLKEVEYNRDIMSRLRTTRQFGGYSVSGGARPSHNHLIRLGGRRAG